MINKASFTLLVGMLTFSQISFGHIRIPTWDDYDVEAEAVRQAVREVTHRDLNIRIKSKKHEKMEDELVFAAFGSIIAFELFIVPGLVCLPTALALNLSFNRSLKAKRSNAHDLGVASNNFLEKFINSKHNKLSLNKVQIENLIYADLIRGKNSIILDHIKNKIYFLPRIQKKEFKKLILKTLPDKLSAQDFDDLIDLANNY